tara:strand:- start:231 stop:443 length:213 start_codon:yes stop_codon:yes gene_type:complete
MRKNIKHVLIIACKNFAKGVYITCISKENFSNNFFDLAAGKLKKVSISLNENERPKEVLKSIKIKIYGVI